MNYPESLAYLDGFVNLERNALNASARAVITLDNVRELARQLGNPQDQLKLIHVAGTKGKGSTCAFAASILNAAGLRIGLYTSPHLQNVRERISIDNKPIPEEDFARILTVCHPVLEKLRHVPQGQRRLTYFEVLTHLAFAWFAEQRVDGAVVEVGLGGRLDATNIIQPVVCGITNISFDHMAILGDTLAKIAGEKAGIIKTSVPVVVAPQNPEALTAIEARAKELTAPLERIGHEIKLIEPKARASKDWRRPSAQIVLPGERRVGATLGLHGGFQKENWAVAVRLADVFHQKLRGKSIPAEAVEKGSLQVQWPGRMQEIAKSSAGDPRLVLDGAHNDHSVKLVVNELLGSPDSRPLVVLFGCAKDKDFGAMLAVLAEAAPDHVVFTHSGHSRGREPADLLCEWQSISKMPASSAATAAEGLAEAKRKAGQQGLVLVTGSLYLVGAVMDLLQ
jgi:dihydrofolate synthase/folylpolyglutamate synthase